MKLVGIGGISQEDAKNNYLKYRKEAMKAMIGLSKTNLREINSLRAAENNNEVVSREEVATIDQ